MIIQIPVSKQEKIVPRAWTKMPKPKSVIDMVEKIGEKEQDITGLMFMNRNKQFIAEPFPEDEINRNKNEIMATYATPS